MIDVKINGFEPYQNSLHNKDILEVYVNYGSENAKKLFSGHQDIKGEVSFQIDGDYKGKQLRIFYATEEFEEVNEVQVVQNLGLFYTIKLATETNSYAPRHNDRINVNELYEKSSKKMDTYKRNAKYSNVGIKLFEIIIITLVTYFTSFLLDKNSTPGYNLLILIIALGFYLITDYLQEYLSGNKKAF